jgi:hypothetical protein
LTLEIKYFANHLVLGTFFSIPIPTAIYRDLGVGVAIGFGVDFFLAE